MNWMYLDKATNAPKGPLLDKMIRRLMQKSYITNNTMVWKEGMTEWKALEQVEPFKSYCHRLNLFWYYIENKAQQGPFGTPQLMQLFKDGDVDGLTLVWTSSMTEWKELGQVEDLRDFLLEASEEHEREQDLFDQGSADVNQDDQVFAGDEPSKVLVAEDGTRYVYDTETRKLVRPEDKIEDDLEALVADVERKEDDESTEVSKTTTEQANEDAEKKKRKKKKNKKKEKWVNAKENTWIYVNGLPLDITEEEVASYFSKCGIIQQDIHTGRPRIKLYSNRQFGGLNGDASICFMNAPSVDLAVQLMDKAEIREGWPLDVSEAIFSQKGDSFVRKKPKLDNKSKVKLIEQKMALSWNDDGGEDAGLRIVVLKKMFKPSDFNDANFGEELENDLTEECGKLGDIEKITVFEKNPQGVVIIKYKAGTSATQCINVMNGRFFGGEKIECGYWDGTDYSYKESKEEVQQRIDDFGTWLENASSDEENEGEDDDVPPPMVEEGHRGRVLPDSPTSDHSEEDEQ